MEYKYPVIDSHVHVYQWFEENGSTYTDAMDTYRSVRNFKAININSIPSGVRDVSNNIMCALYKLSHPETYIHGGLVYPEYPIPETLPAGMDCLTQYDELLSIGFDGIKMLETKPDHYRENARPVNDPIYEDFFAKAEKDGTHFVWHVADPETFWDLEKIPKDFIELGWCYADGTYAPKEQIYKDVFDVLDRHPELNVTFAHFFFMAFQPERLEKVFKKYPGVNVDLTPGTEMYEAFENRHEYYRSFFRTYSNRLEFGTDSSDESSNNLTMLPDGVYTFLTSENEADIYDVKARGLNLPESAAKAILSGNFIRRVGDTPRPINKTALKAYILKYRKMIKDEKVQCEINRKCEQL